MRPSGPDFPRPPRPAITRHVGPTGRWYALGSRDGAPWLRCDRCGRVSSHPQDVERRYCGGCRVPLDAPEPDAPTAPPTYSDGRAVADVAPLAASGAPEGHGASDPRPAQPTRAERERRALLERAEARMSAADYATFRRLVGAAAGAGAG